MHETNFPNGIQLYNLKNSAGGILTVDGSGIVGISTSLNSISGSLQAQITQISGYTQANTNSINTLFSTYANSSTVAAISAGLNSRISTLSSPSSSAFVNDFDVRYVNVSGDSMSGTLTFSGAGIQFDTAYTIPSVEGRLGYDQSQYALVYRNDTSDVHIGQEQVARVRNNTGSTIAAGKAVVINGALGNRPTVALADNTTLNAYDTLGIVTQSISNNTDGMIVVSGLAHDFDTSSFSDGDTLWLGTSGNLTNIQPSDPTRQVKIGYCIRSHASLGKVLVRLAISPAFNDLTDVSLTSVTSNDILIYNQANQLWENKNQTIALSGTLATYAPLSVVSSISGNLNNSINTLFSTYANSSTVAAISAGLNSKFVSLNLTESISGNKTFVNDVSISGAMFLSVPSQIVGLGSIWSIPNDGVTNTDTISGAGTSFLSQIRPGDCLVTSSVSRMVKAVDSDTQLSLFNWTAFTTQTQGSWFISKPEFNIRNGGKSVLIGSQLAGQSLFANDENAPIITVYSSHPSSAFGLVRIVGPSPTNNGVGQAFTCGVDGERFGRAVFYNNGIVGFGPGTSTRDIFLYRTLSNRLGISDNPFGTPSTAGGLDVYGSIVANAGSFTTSITSGSLVGQNGAIVTHDANGALTDSGTLISSLATTSTVEAISAGINTRINAIVVPSSASFLVDYDTRYVNISGDTMLGTLNINDLKTTKTTGTPIDLSSFGDAAGAGTFIKFNSSTIEGYSSGFLKDSAGNLYMNLVADVAGNTILGGGVAGDTFRRVRIINDGQIAFGPGNAARDVRLYRSTTNKMVLDDNAGGPGEIEVYNATINTLKGSVNGGTGAFTWSSSGNDFGGMINAFGPVSSSTLTGRVIGGGVQTVTGPESFNRFFFYSTGTLGVGPGTSTRDTFLFRNGTSRFAVADSPFSPTTAGGLDVYGNLTVGNGATISGSASLSSQLLLSNGSVSSPSLSFVTNPITGLYLNSANSISLTTAGTETLRMGPTSFFFKPTTAVNINPSSIGTDISLNGGTSFGVGTNTTVAPLRSLFAQSTNTGTAAIFGNAICSSNAPTMVGVEGTATVTNGDGSLVGVKGTAIFSTAGGSGPSRAIGGAFYASTSTTNTNKISYGILSYAQSVGTSNASSINGISNTVYGTSTSDSIIGEVTTVSNFGNFLGTTIKGSATNITMAGNPSPSASTVRGIELTMTINQSGSVGYTGIYSNTVEAASGSGTKRLIDLQFAGTSRLNVDNTGIMTVNTNTSAANIFAIPGVAGTIIGAVGQNENAARITIVGFDNTNASNSPALTCFRARGNSAAPTAIRADDVIWSASLGGYQATQWSPVRAAFRAYAAENWTDSAYGVYWSWIMPSAGGGTPSSTEKMRLWSDGGLEVGTPSSSPGASSIKSTNMTVAGLAGNTNKLVTVDSAGKLQVGTLTDAKINATEDNVYIESPTNKTYPIISYANVPKTLTAINGLTTSTGTCTVAIQINGTPVTFTGSTTTANVSAGAQQISIISGGTVASNARVTVVVTNTVGAGDLEFTLAGART